MGKKRFFIFLFLLLSLLLSSMLSAEARALRDLKLQYYKGMFKGLFPHAGKVSGPSMGVGHRYNNLQTIEVVEKSGPSSGGEGHK
ncbi:hypothetical protein REPUB_Repub01dG0192800 [Reevesia pubescens]